MNPLFSTLPANVEKEAEFIYRRILNEKLLDCTTHFVSSAIDEVQSVSNIRQVDINSIHHEESRTFGGEWLSKQMLDDC